MLMFLVSKLVMSSRGSLGFVQEGTIPPAGAISQWIGGMVDAPLVVIGIMIRIGDSSIPFVSEEVSTLLDA